MSHTFKRTRFINLSISFEPYWELSVCTKLWMLQLRFQLSAYGTISHPWFKHPIKDYDIKTTDTEACKIKTGINQRKTELWLCEHIKFRFLVSALLSESDKLRLQTDFQVKLVNDRRNELMGMKQMFKKKLTEIH